ncbi:hypothetical protein GFY24_04785 [Nocardia sp. SYP-A9097]|uniref:hypothetical protein n=1 Tax=Nocardia sp. SYP-A9097 TaxID=2663237 RepID=UPI00129BB02A|nr:hypothetical protein [Nocardia sp. SYP-A9097]MRH86791.1 hypothetical protein [Nocardia sp. SYP-A9097]
MPADEAGRERMARAHHALAAPLREALAERGDPDPVLTADLIDGALGRAIDRLDGGADFRRVQSITLAFVQRAIGLSNNQE